MYLLSTMLYYLGVLGLTSLTIYLGFIRFPTPMPFHRQTTTTTSSCVFTAHPNTTTFWPITNRLCTMSRLLLSGKSNLILFIFSPKLPLEKQLLSEISITRSIPDGARRYAELVGPQSCAKRHKSSSDHTTRFAIIIGGLRSWVQPRQAKDEGNQEWQEGWQRQMILFLYYCNYYG